MRLLPVFIRIFTGQLRVSLITEVCVSSGKFIEKTEFCAQILQIPPLSTRTPRPLLSPVAVAPCPVMKKLLSILILLGACSPPSAAPPEEPPPPKPPSTSSGQAPGGLSYEAPKEWTSEKPSMNMRKAQYGVPDKEKQAANATFIYFGTMGGGVEGNFSRWKGQFNNVQGEPKAEEFKGAAGDVNLLDLAGDFDSGGMSGDPIKGARMLAAILATDAGDHIFVLRGPHDTVGDWRSEFVAMLKSAKIR